MTQTTSIDLGAVAAPPRREYAPGPKNQSDFVRAYRQAETSAPEPKKNDRPERPDTDRKDPLEKNVADAKNAPVDAPKAEQPKGDKADKAEAPKAEAPRKDAETPQGDVKAEAPAQTPEEAQAALALALATGGQLATPQAEPSETEAPVAEETVAVVADAKTATQEGQEAADAAVAEAKGRAIAADAAKAQGQQQAAAKAQAPQVAQATEHASENAQLPAFLQQAAQGLGKVSMTAQTEQVPGQPTGSQEAVLDPESSNLTIEMIDQAPKTVTTGSNTQAALLDDVADIETSIQSVTLIEGEETAEEGAVTEDGPDGLTALNGDKAQIHGGKASEVKAPTQAPPDPEEVMPQILKHAEQLKANQQSSIKLHLYPEHLGRLEIKVTTVQGVIQAQLTADSQSVKGMLEGQMAHLQRSFAEMGLKVDKVEVTLASANMQFDASGQMAQGQADQGYGQQQRTSQQTSAFNGSGYEQWLPEELGEEGYADLASLTAINYVA